MQTVTAVLRGGPGDGQTVQVQAWRIKDGGFVPRSSAFVTVLDGRAHVLDADADVVNRAARQGARWTVYVLLPDQPDEPGRPFVYGLAPREIERAAKRVGTPPGAAGPGGPGNFRPSENGL